MSLVDTHPWRGRIYDGKWVEPSGGTRPVVEPATGAHLGTIGVAGPGDLRRAGTQAAEAQRGWARVSFEQRAAVLRRAGDLWAERAAEVHEWLVREAGSVPAKAAVETHGAANECYEAASLASAPYGALLPSAEPRLSLARRVPAGVVAVIAPFNFR